MASLQQLAAADKTAQVADSGWYILVACVGSVLVSGTRIAPIAVGILGVSLIYQLNLMLKKK